MRAKGESPFLFLIWHDLLLWYLKSHWLTDWLTDWMEIRENNWSSAVPSNFFSHPVVLLSFISGFDLVQLQIEPIATGSEKKYGRVAGEAGEKLKENNKV